MEDTAPKPTFSDYAELVLKPLLSKGRRVYEQTFREWQAWCVQIRLNPLDLRAANINRFLSSQKVSYHTRQRHLSALRTLGRVVFSTDPRNATHRKLLEELDALQVPKQELTPSQRQVHKLTAEQADSVLSVWKGMDTISRRNRAIVALLFITGIRLSEVAFIQRDHVNIDDGLIFIPHYEKKDLSRTVAIPSKAAIQALREWMDYLDPSRNYLFPRINKGGRPRAEDHPMSERAIHFVAEQTEELTGLVFSPQDARRTFLTEALESGSPLRDVQAQAGHKNVASTLLYAKPDPNVKNRGRRLKLPYGKDEQGGDN